MSRDKAFVESAAVARALDLFWAQGYGATSVQQLCDHVGLSRSSIYDTFGDKHGLFLEALDRYRSVQEAGLREPFQRLGYGRAALEALLRRVAQGAANDPQRRGCFIVNCTVELAQTDAEVAQRIDTNRQRAESQFRKAIEAGQAAGEITTQRSAAALARYLFAAMQGIVVMAKAGASRAELDELVTTTLSVLDA